MSSLTHKPEKGMATMIRSHHITEVLMFVSETKEHSGREAGHSSASVRLHKSTGRRLRKTIRLNPR